MLLNCSVGEDSWESLGLQGNPTSQFWRRFLWDFFGENDAEAETPVLLPGRSHGQRSLVRYSLWVAKSWTRLRDFTSPSLPPEMFRGLKQTLCAPGPHRDWDRTVFEHLLWRYSLGFPGGSEVKASVYNAGDLGLSPGLGRSPGEGNGSPLQCYCLENPMDRGAL